MIFYNKESMALDALFVLVYDKPIFVLKCTDIPDFPRLEP